MSKIFMIGSDFSYQPIKKKYPENILYAAQDISLVSVMSEAIIYDRKKVDELKLSNEVYSDLVSEYEKDVLQMLRTSNPSLIFVDFFTDLTKGVIRLKNNTYLTNKIKLYEISKVVDLTECEIFSLIEDYEVYINIWAESFRKFASFVEENLPEAKLVILSSQLPLQNSLYAAKETILINTIWKKLIQYVESFSNIEIVSVQPKHLKNNMSNLSFNLEYGYDFFHSFNDIFNQSSENGGFDYEGVNLLRNPTFDNDFQFCDWLVNKPFFKVHRDGRLEAPGAKGTKLIMSEAILTDSLFKGKESSYHLSFDVLVADMGSLNISKDLIMTIATYPEKTLPHYTRASQRIDISAYFENVTSKKWKKIDLTFSVADKYFRIIPSIYASQPVCWKNFKLTKV